jgi:hypothetical protein
MNKTKIEWTDTCLKKSKVNKKLMEKYDYAAPIIEKMKKLLLSKSKNVKK